MVRMSLGDNRDRGLDVEDDVSDIIPAVPIVDDRSQRDDWYDLEFYEAPIECKSCLEYYERSNGRKREGRWWIAKRNHEKLLEDGGWYAFAVVDSEGEIQRTALVHVDSVDDYIDDDWWSTGNGGQGVEEYRQIPWTAVFGGGEDGSGGGLR